jgi:tetratricopeptide (TPR) repeat protein
VSKAGVLKSNSENAFGKQGTMIVGGKVRNSASYRVFDMEVAIQAKLRDGDLEGALQALRRALRVNPQDACFRYLRGVLHHSVGMPNEALQDLESALALARKPELIMQIQQAILAVEQEQLDLLNVLFAEDKMFRLEFGMDPARAAKARGFKLSQATERALPLLVGGSRVIFQPTQPGVC